MVPSGSIVRPWRSSALHFRSFVFLVACASASAAHAGIVNGGFEDPALSPNQFTSLGINGWTWDGTSGVWYPGGTSYFDSVPEGSQVGYLNSSALAQQTNDFVSVGVQSVSFSMGRRKDGFQGNATINLFAGGTVSNGAVTGGVLLDSITVLATSIPVGGWTQHQLSYTATGSDPQIGQLLSVQIVKDSGSQINFDDFTIQAVPEPATLAALGLGALALRRRRRS